MTTTLSGVKFETFLDLSLHNESSRCIELMIDWIAEARGFEVRSGHKSCLFFEGGRKYESIIFVGHPL